VCGYLQLDTATTPLMTVGWVPSYASVE